MDPGFPRGERQPERGRQRIIWPKFAKNCMKMRKIGLNGGVQILLCRSAPVYNEMTPFLRHIKDSIQTCQLIYGYLKLDVLKRRPLVRSLNLHQIQKKINQGLLNVLKQFACLIRKSRIKLNSNFVGRKIVLLLYKVKY